MTKPTREEIDAALTGKKFYKFEEIVADTKLWIALLWSAMSKAGKGYRRHSLRHSGRGDDRRKDKLEFAGPQKYRRYRDRYQSG